MSIVHVIRTATGFLLVRYLSEPTTHSLVWSSLRMNLVTHHHVVQRTKICWDVTCNFPVIFCGLVLNFATYFVRLERVITWSNSILARRWICYAKRELVRPVFIVSAVLLTKLLNFSLWNFSKPNIKIWLLTFKKTLQQY